MSTELTKSIGKTVRAARISLGLTQEDVAEQLGIGVQFYGRIERGNSLPSMATLLRMIQVLGVSASALVGGRAGRSGHEKRSRLQREKPALRRLLRQLRQASPNTIRVVTALLDGLGIPAADEED